MVMKIADRNLFVEILNDIRRWQISCSSIFLKKCFLHFQTGRNFMNLEFSGWHESIFQLVL